MNELQKIVNEIQYRTQKTVEQIANDIEYRRNYLSSEIKKGESVVIKDLLIKKYRKYLTDYLSDTTNSLVLHDDGGYPDISVNTLIAQQNKLIQSLNKQSETANEILRRVADNIEQKVSQLDASLNDALGRVDSIKIGMFSGRVVVLQSLARLENKPENALLVEADNITRSLMDQQQDGQGTNKNKNKKNTS